MPPLLALTACIAFVLFLLKFERKQSREVGRALWLPTIWMLYIASKPLAYWFSYRTVDPQEGSPLDRSFMIILICAALLVLIRRKFDWTRAIKNSIPLFVLVVFMLVSVSWSALPFVSFKRWTQELLAVLMAFTVLSEPSPRLVIESILRRTVYVLIPFSAVLIKYFPAYGTDYAPWSGRQMWTGVTLQKNSLGRLCIISIFFLIWSLTRRRREKIASVWKYETHAELLLIAISIWLLLGPERSPFMAATSFYALLAALIVYAGLLITRKMGVTFKSSIITVFAASIIIVGTAALFTGASDIGFAAAAAGRDRTLTGRTDVWAALLPIAMKNPVLGSGFGGFWTSRTRLMFEISGAHNGYLEVLLALGFTGIVLLSVFYLSSCRKAHSMLSVDYYWGSLWICLIIMHLVHNIAEASIDSFASQLSAIILFLTVSSLNSASPGQGQDG